MLIKVKRLRRTMSHQGCPPESGTALPPSLARRADASASLRPPSGEQFRSAVAPLVVSSVCAIHVSAVRWSHFGREKLLVMLDGQYACAACAAQDTGGSRRLQCNGQEHV